MVQTSLATDRIFILDALFDIYVWVGQFSQVLLPN